MTAAQSSLTAPGVGVERLGHNSWRVGRLRVKAPLTRKRAGRTIETAEFAAFTRRIVRAYGRRIASGDVDALPELLKLAREVETVTAQAVNGLRAEGYSWGEIAARLGTSRQAAQQRFGRAS